MLAGVLLVVMLVVLVVGPALVRADTSYRVQSGDTLSGIAQRYGVTIDAIVTANGLSSRTIYAGQSLTIPSAGSQAAVQPANGTYTVQPGDTLSGIAVRFGTTTDALQRANGLGSTTIYVGQLLKIVGPNSAPPPPKPTNTPAPQPIAPTVPPTLPPTQQPATTTLPPTQQPVQPPTQTASPTLQPQPSPTNPANPATYNVQPGDSLTAVAARFGVTRQALAAANGISPSSLLYVGQVLQIPGVGSQPPSPTKQPPPATATTAPAQPSATPAQQPAGSASTTTPQPAASSGAAEAGKPVQYTVQPGDTMASIAAKFNTSLEALVKLNNLQDVNYVYVGQVLTIVKGNDQSNDTPAVTPVTEPTPPMGQFGPKWVDVTLSTQTMIAYEGQTPVFTAKVSSGVPRHPTVEGIYRVYAKYTSTRMKGGEGAEHYDIPNVPYTMYFYADYALHGAFWHNNFGHPMSHGCVNLPVDVSTWLFNWAPIGTLVVTHK